MKAILEMDVPESCFDCNISTQDQIASVYKGGERKVFLMRCTLNYECVQEYDSDKRAPFCPLKFIDEVHTTKPVKHGEWVKLGLEVVCSECRQYFHDKFTANFNFCPHCGADMRTDK